MEFIKKLSIKKSFVIFFTVVFINFGINFLVFNYNFIPELIAEYQKIADFTLSQFKEKNIEIKLEKTGITLNQESFLIESEDFPIKVATANLVFISKNANYADFKEKNTLAILNDKELVLNLNNEFQNLPIEALLGERNDITLNLAFIENLNQTLFNNSAELVRNYFYIAFGVEKIIFYFAQGVWGFIILPFIAFYILKFSGFTADKTLLKVFGLIYYSLFLVLEPILFNFRIPVNFIHVFILGFILVTLLMKKDMESKDLTDKNL